MWVGRVAKPNSSLDINTRFILNTFEQFTAYFIANAGLAMYCPPEEARSLPLSTALFVMGRHPVLDRLSQEPVPTRLRLRHHLLSDVGGLRLACPDHGVRHPHPALALSAAFNSRLRTTSTLVMAGLVPAIHVLVAAWNSWMPGTSAGDDEPWRQLAWTPCFEMCPSDAAQHEGSDVTSPPANRE